jgi:hypothetical protein
MEALPESLRIPEATANACLPPKDLPVLKLIKFNLPTLHKSTTSQVSPITPEMTVARAPRPFQHQGASAKKKKQFWTRFFRDFVTFLTSSRSASVTCDRREIIRRFGAL